MSALKRAAKGIGRFVKKYWKVIVIAAAVFFGAGLATVGTSGFGAAAGTVASGGAGATFGSVMSAAGSTMVAGAASIGGSLGIGQGANLAGFGGTGYATLGTGAAAQGLGLASGSNAAMTAGRTAQLAKAPSYLPSSVVANAGGAASTAASTTGTGGNWGAFGPSGGNWTAAGGNGIAGAAGAAGSGFMQSPYAGVAIQAGMGLISGYLQQRDADENKPRGFFAVGLNGTPSLEGPLPGAPRDAQGNVQPMWDANSFRRPNSPDYSGNAALDGPHQQQGPASPNFLAPDADVTAQHIGPRRG